MVDTYEVRFGLTHRLDAKRVRWAILFFLLALSVGGWAVVGAWKCQHGEVAKAAVIDKATDNLYVKSHFILISEKGVCPTDPVTWAKAKPGTEITCEWLKGERQ